MAWYGQESLVGDDIPVRYEPTPDTLELGWFVSEADQEIQMAKVHQRDRATHMYVIGATGSGKTKFLEFLIQQDLVEGRGFGVIDPHGDLVEDIKGFVACEAEASGDSSVLDRVVLVEPTATGYTVAFNPLERLPGVSAAEQAQELLSAFRKIWAESWGVRMEDLLRNSLIALSEAELTLVELPLFLTSSDFRRRVLGNVTHPMALTYFERFDAQSERTTLTWTEPVMNKVNALLADDRVRLMFASPRSSFQFRDIMDSGKVLLLNLDKGRLQDSADLLGALFMAKLKMAAFSRSDIPQNRRQPFYLYVDEFQNFATGSFSVVLSEARKYGLALVMAHQTLAQVSSELRSLVLGNTGIQVYFRVGHQDAQVLANEAFLFSPHDVKSASMRGVRYRSAGEQRQSLAQDIQDLPPRVCFVKHKIEGGLVALRTVDIESPQEFLGLDSAGYASHLVDLRVGGHHLLPREQVEQELTSRRQMALSRPATVDAEPQPSGQTILERARPTEVSSTSAQPVRPAVAPPPAGAPPIDRELLDYLEHVAIHPFVSALQRDGGLNLSRYKGAQLRERLLNGGFVKAHKVSAGRRSGQLLLLEMTKAGYDLLGSMKVRATSPRGRGGFLHRYYAHKLKEYAELAWLGCSAELERNTSGRVPDVTVTLPADDERPARTIVFEVYNTGEAKEVRGLVKDAELFDETIVCAENPQALDALNSRLRREAGSELTGKIRFDLISPYLAETTARTARPKSESPRSAPLAQKKAPEPEAEMGRTEVQPGKPRSRGRKTPLLKEIEQAILHMHDLDWLQESSLTRVPAVRDAVDPTRALPEAQALRDLLVASARQAIEQLEAIPNERPVALFLRRHLEGRTVAEIARELGVSREWCSRAYRTSALSRMAAQFAHGLVEQTEKPLNPTNRR